jgi:hypothetical protein
MKMEYVNRIPTSYVKRAYPFQLTYVQSCAADWNFATHRIVLHYFILVHLSYVEIHCLKTSSKPVFLNLCETAAR